jgi:hypothetical protein
MSDWIEVVEAGYDLSLGRADWLERVLETAAPLMDQGVGVNAQIFRVSATHLSKAGRRLPAGIVCGAR